MLGSRNTEFIKQAKGRADLKDDDSSLLRKAKSKNIANTLKDIINWFSALESESDVALD